MSPFSLTFALECAVRKFKENEGLKLSETHHCLVCTGHVRLLSNKISAMKMNTDIAYKKVVRKLSICSCRMNRM